VSLLDPQAPIVSVLLRCVRLNLRTRQIECYDYAESSNPPILHRKEAFLLADDELHAKFARLTMQEEKQGLLANPSSIGTRDGWGRRLVEHGFALKGHRLVKIRVPPGNGDGESVAERGAANGTGPDDQLQA
jgi:hypothetical protein